MQRFVVLTHDHPSLHWDFMLEKEAALRTWRLVATADSRGPVAAEGLPDHRLAYLDYEGPVSGDRGTVVRWDRGEYMARIDDGHRIEIDLKGDRLKGRALLLRTQGESVWQYYFTPVEPPRVS